MRERPPYFNAIHDYAASEWDKLESSSWGRAVHHLFSQVQSPQHVISELLQKRRRCGRYVGPDAPANDGPLPVRTTNGRRFHRRAVQIPLQLRRVSQEPAPDDRLSWNWLQVDIQVSGAPWS